MMPIVPATDAAMRCGITPMAVTSLNRIDWVMGRFGFMLRRSARISGTTLRSSPVRTSTATRGINC